MIKPTLNIITCVTILLLTSCTGQVTHKQRLTETINDSLPNKSLTKATDQIEKAADANDGLIRIYSQAIADYITEVSRQHLITVDTLFFGKRNNGQPDDFPDIVLPNTINHCEIRLIDAETGKKLQEEKKSRIYINLMGWADKDKAEFIFVSFSNGFEHQFDYHIGYKYNSASNAFEVTKSRMEMFSKK